MIIRLVLYSSVYFNHYFYLLVAPNVARLGHARASISLLLARLLNEFRGYEINVSSNCLQRVLMIDDERGLDCPVVYAPNRPLPAS
jgi:hypothetical protein